MAGFRTLLEIILLHAVQIGFQMEFLGVGVVLRASPTFHKPFSRNLILGTSMTKEGRRTATVLLYCPVGLR